MPVSDNSYRYYYTITPCMTHVLFPSPIIEQVAPRRCTHYAIGIHYTSAQLRRPLQNTSSL